MSTNGTTCADLNCNTSPNCSISPTCPLVRDRLVVILTVFADKLDMLLVALTGSIFAICSAIIVVGGHGEPPAVSLATMLAGFGLGIMAYFRLKAGQVATVKSLERVERKTSKAAEKAAESVVRTDETANAIIRSQTTLFKRVEEVHDLANNKAKAVEKAHDDGFVEGKTVAIAVVAEAAPQIAPSLTQKILNAKLGDSQY